MPIDHGMVLKPAGIHGGPCSAGPCPHAECEAIRQKAARACAYCHKPIGYLAPYHDSVPDGAREIGPVHATCHEDQVWARGGG